MTRQKWRRRFVKVGNSHDVSRGLSKTSSAASNVVQMFVAQDEMAGAGVGISDELISLQITSANVPDLTLIDLPGIARVAVKGQPENIGDQVNYISQMTLCWKVYHGLTQEMLFF